MGIGGRGVSFPVQRYAGVVKLVDALASGASGRKPVGVRVPPSALIKKRGRDSVLASLLSNFSQFVPYSMRPRGLPCVGFGRRNVLWQIRRAIDLAQCVVGLGGVSGEQLDRTRQRRAGAAGAI